MPPPAYRSFITGAVSDYGASRRKVVLVSRSRALTPGKQALATAQDQRGTGLDAQTTGPQGSEEGGRPERVAYAIDRVMRRR